MISVVMPTYNRAATLPRAIDSILRQTHTDWELIVVDDGSTDETAEILAAIGDSRLRVFHHPKNRGVSAAKNTGFDHIQGDWFTTVSSDDEIVPDALAVMLECAQRTGATAISCNCTDFVTGRKSGAGLTHEGWVSEEEVSRSRGDYFGLTKTSLLGDLRLDERLPGYDNVVWLPLNRHARRYYCDRNLKIFHTEGADRVSLEKKSVREKVRRYSALGEHREYLGILRETAPREFRRTMLRVWAARLLGPLLRGSESPRR